MTVFKKFSVTLDTEYGSTIRTHLSKAEVIQLVELTKDQESRLDRLITYEHMIVSNATIMRIQ